MALAVSVSGVGDDFKSIGIDTFESVKEAGAAAAAAAPAALRTVRGILMEPREGASQHAVRRFVTGPFSEGIQGAAEQKLHK